MKPSPLHMSRIRRGRAVPWRGWALPRWARRASAGDGLIPSAYEAQQRGVAQPRWGVEPIPVGFTPIHRTEGARAGGGPLPAARSAHAKDLAPSFNIPTPLLGRLHSGG